MTRVTTTDVHSTEPCIAALPPPVFFALAQSVDVQPPLRSAITAAYRCPESACVQALLEQAKMPNAEVVARIRALAYQLVSTLRDKGSSSGVEALMQQFSLLTDVTQPSPDKLAE